MVDNDNDTWRFVESHVPSPHGRGPPFTFSLAGEKRDIFQELLRRDNVDLEFRIVRIS